MPVTCSRTGRLENKQLTADEAVSFSQTLTTRLENTRKFESEAGQLTADDSRPDLIVSYKGKAVALAVVGEKSHESVLRLLAKLTNREDVFPPPAVKPRKRNEKPTPEESVEE